MKYIISLSIILFITTSAVAQYIAPDYYGEPPRRGISFWKNMGQVKDTDGNLRPDISYYSTGGLPRLYMKKGSKMSFVMYRTSLILAGDTAWRLDMNFAGSKVQSVDPIYWNARDHYQNFYLPHCGPNGVTGVTGYERIIYQGVYPRTDVHFYSGSGGQKMAIVVRPGGDPADIEMEFTGQDSLQVDWQGHLRMYLQGRWIKLEEAQAYQVGPGNSIINVAWTANYQHNAGTALVKFQFDTYDTTKPLIFQVGPTPVSMGGGGGNTPCWATYFGSSDNDEVQISAVDAAGNYYASGFSISTFIDFPSNGGVNVLGAFDRAVFLTRFDENHALIWTNFYGAQGTPSQRGFDIAIRESPYAIYLVGSTPDSSLHRLEQPGAYYDDTGSDLYANGFIAKFNIGGFLLWSTYFGNYRTYIRGADIDAQGRLWIAGETDEEVPQPNGGQPSGAHTQPYNGGVDAFVAVFDENDDLYWSTALGGSSSDQAKAVRCHGNRAIVVGETTSTNYQPILHPGSPAYQQTANAGTYDVFITQFDLAGAVEWSTHFGGTGADVIESSQTIRLGPTGDLFIGGLPSADLEVIPGPGWHNYTPTDNFIAKFSGSDRSRQWVTYFADVPQHLTLKALALDNIGNLYAAGQTRSSFAIQPVELPGVYYQPTPNGLGPLEEYRTDCFLMSFTPQNYRAWSTYFGGDDYLQPYESILTLAVDQDFLYAGGFTSKNFVDQDSYFPLHDPGNGAWYEPNFSAVFDFNADGFIAAFCTDFFTSITDHDSYLSQSLMPYFMDNDNWSFSGLELGTYHIHIVDMLGRMIARDRILVTDVLSSPVNTSSLAEGAYTVTFEKGYKRASARILIQR